MSKSFKLQGRNLFDFGTKIDVPDENFKHKHVMITLEQYQEYIHLKEKFEKIKEILSCC